MTIAGVQKEIKTKTNANNYIVECYLPFILEFLAIASFPQGYSWKLNFG